VRADLAERAGVRCWFVGVRFAGGSHGHLDLTMAVEMDWHGVRDDLVAGRRPSEPSDRDAARDLGPASGAGDATPGAGPRRDGDQDDDRGGTLAGDRYERWLVTNRTAASSEGGLAAFCGA
jgi:hypothetical protein